MYYLIDIILCLAILFTCKGQDVVLTTTRVCYYVNDDMTLEAEYKGQATVDGVIWTLTGGSSVMTIAVSTCSSPFVIPIGFPDGRMSHDCSTAPIYRLIVKTLESTDFNKTWGVDFSLITGSTSSGTQQQTVVQCETISPSYPPILETVVAENSMKHTCSVTTKGTPEVSVTIKVGEEEKSTATHSVSCDNHDDISCCITGDAFDCLSGTERCVKLGGASDCVLKTGSIVFIVLSAIPLIVVIAVLIFCGLQYDGCCDLMPITCRYCKLCNGRTWLCATILVEVVAGVISLLILTMSVNIHSWCLDCEDKCTLDRCSNTWRKGMLISCGVCLGIFYIVILIFAILCKIYTAKSRRVANKA